MTTSNTVTQTDLKNILDSIFPSSLVDMFYPVGSYYETSDTSFDPNASWGGTWVLETEGQVHISGSASGTYQITGAPTDTNDGGASTVGLETKHLPAHTHGSKTLTGYFQIRRYGTVANTGAIGITSSGIVSRSNPTGQNEAYNVAGTSVGSTTHERITITATHEHTSVGSGTAHNNMPPYIIVNRWHRTA